VHGGLILSLTDTLGSLAVSTRGQYMTGVSTDIGTTFVRPAGRIGDTLHAKAYLLAMGERNDLIYFPGYLTYLPIGRTLAYTKVDFFDQKGTLVAFGRKCTLSVTI
jgi:acyl-coenzyme A thioesterase 13